MRKLVLIHGFATDSSIWQKQVEFFKDKYDLIVPTLETHDKNAALKLAKELEDLKSINILGWSMGGNVALWLAERLRDKLKSLILVSTTPQFIRTKNFGHAIFIEDLKNLERKILTRQDKGLNYFYKLANCGDENHRDSSLCHYERSEVILSFKNEIASSQTPRNDRLENLAQDLKTLTILDQKSLLEKISCPTLIIQGDKDMICLPPAAEYMQKKIKNSKMKIMENTSHIPFLTHPQEFNKIIGDFLNIHAG